MDAATWSRAERAAAELDCGYTWINSPTKVYDELPFGGVKASGYGKEHGSEALDYYTDTKSVVVGRAERIEQRGERSTCRARSSTGAVEDGTRRARWRSSPPTRL